MLTLSAAGTAMSNLAMTYTVLGRHQDALVLQEETLEFLRRVLPENHPHIGKACSGIALLYYQASDFHRALQFCREALRIFQATLPPSHPQVSMTQLLVRQLEEQLLP
jgi:tetratricopeptide (TPR) repeat protein